MEKVKIGVIGPGKVFQWEHWPALQRNPDAEVVALCARRKDRLQKVADHCGIKKIYTSAEDMLNKEELDAALVLTPHHTHSPLTALVAEHGVNVFCEKPMALTLKEADEMIEACRKAGVKLAVACNERFAPLVQRAKEIIDRDFSKVTNAFSKMIYSIAEFAKEGYPVPDATDPNVTFTEHWRDDPKRYGSMTHDLLVHVYDLVRYLINAEPKTLYAELGTLAYANLGMEDNVSSVIRYDNDAMATFILSLSGTEAFGFERIEVMGIGRMLLIDDFHTVRYHVFGKPVEEWRKPGASTDLYGPSGRTSLWGGYENQMDHFIDCVKNDKPLMNTGEEGRKALEMVVATLQSARERGVVEFPL